MLTGILNYGESFDYSFEELDLSLTDWTRLLKAAKVAERSYHDFRVGCVVAKKNKIYSESVNKRTTHPNLYPNRQSIHAEINALKLVHNPKNSTVYVARLGKSGIFNQSLPCLYCIDAMTLLGVSKIVCTMTSTTATSFRLSSVRSPHLIRS